MMDALGWQRMNRRRKAPVWLLYGRFLLKDGEPHQVALLEMEALPASKHDNAEKIITHSRARRGTERRIVEGRIERFLGREKPSKVKKLARWP
jgi:hypothetical protein